MVRMLRIELASSEQSSRLRVRVASAVKESAVGIFFYKQADIRSKAAPFSPLVFVVVMIVRHRRRQRAERRRLATQAEARRLFGVVSTTYGEIDSAKDRLDPFFIVAIGTVEGSLEDDLNRQKVAIDKAFDRLTTAWRNAADDTANDPETERDQAGYDANVTTWQSIAESATELKLALDKLASECQKAEEQAKQVPTELARQRALVENLVAAHVALRDQGYQAVDNGFLEQVPQRFVEVDEQISARCYGEASELLAAINAERANVLAMIKEIPILHRRLLERLALLKDGQPTLNLLLLEARANLAPARQLYAKPNWAEAEQVWQAADALAEGWRERLSAAQASISKETRDWEAAKNNVKRLEDDMVTIGRKCQRVIGLISEVDNLAKTLIGSVETEQAEVAKARRALRNYRGAQGSARQDLAEAAAVLSALANDLCADRPHYRVIHEQLVNTQAARELIMNAAEKQHRKAVQAARAAEAQRQRERDDDDGDDLLGLGAAVVGGILLGGALSGGDGGGWSDNDDPDDNWGGGEVESDGNW